jgi:hypothetical protein
MREKMERMQREIEELVAFVREHIGGVSDAPARDALVRVPGLKIIRSRISTKE